MHGVAAPQPTTIIISSRTRQLWHPKVKNGTGQPKDPSDHRIGHLSCRRLPSSVRHALSWQPLLHLATDHPPHQHATPSACSVAFRPGCLLAPRVSERLGTRHLLWPRHGSPPGTRQRSNTTVKSYATVQLHHHRPQPPQQRLRHPAGCPVTLQGVSPRGGGRLPSIATTDAASISAGSSASERHAPTPTPPPHHPQGS